MTVKELFEKVNKEDVFLAYLRRYTIIEDFDHRFSVAQEVQIYKEFKSKLFGFIDKIKNTPINTETDHILFVVDVNAMNYEDKNKTRFDVFSVNKEDYLKQLPDIKIWEGENALGLYAILMQYEEIANYEIANKSLKEYGETAIASAICHELQIFDFGNNKEAIEDFNKSLEESLSMYFENPDAKCYDAETAFELLKQEIYAGLDKDAKKYQKEKDKFDKAVESIVDNWVTEQIEANEVKTVNFLVENGKEYM